MLKIRVGAAQIEHKDGDINYNLKTIEDFVKQASKNKVKIIAFPECCITGYMFLEKLSAREVINIAQTLDGDVVHELNNIAKKNNIIISAGMIEKDLKNNIYNTYVTIGPKGLISAYRKLHPFINPVFKPGNEYKIYNIFGWKLSTLICYDNHLPENCRVVSLLGTEILFMPHQTGGFNFPAGRMGIIPKKLWFDKARDPESLRREFLGPKGREWVMKWLPSRAYDNSYYIIYVNGVGIDGSEVRPGNTSIIDPNGLVIAETNSLGNDLVIADCNKEELKKSLGYLHKLSRRPSLYKIICSGEDGKTEKVWKQTGKKKNE